MAKIDWPAADKRSLIGKRIDRIDGPLKATGAAKYSYDINRPGMLWAKVVTSPHPHAEITSIDTTAAEALAGVKGVWRDTEKEVRYAGEIVAAVAAVTEEIAEEAARLVKVQYKPLEHQVVDTDPSLSKDKASKKDQGNVDEAFAKADKVVAGEYGLPVVTHCCLEPHGQVTEVRDGELYVWPSTQNVSRYSDRLGEAVGIDQNKIHVECQYMGGGFGSKFNYDKHRVDDGGQSSFGLRENQSRRAEGRHDHRRGSRSLGHRRDGRLRSAADPLCVHQGPPHAPDRQRHPHQPGRSAGLARPEPSARLLPDDVRPGGHGGGAEDG